MGCDISGLVILDAISKLKKVLKISQQVGFLQNLCISPFLEVPAVSFCSDGL